MENSISLDRRVKALLILMALCAFFSILAAFDTSEHYRAWRTAKTWTEEQKHSASALDVDRMLPLIIITLAADTMVIAMSFTGALFLGIAVSTESKFAFFLAQALGWASSGVGLAYSTLMIVYRLFVGHRVLLKGPIFDYDLHLQVPIMLAVWAFPVIFGIFSFRMRLVSRTL